MRPSSQRVLVTGAAGFVGASLARQLAHRGHDVRAMVRPESVDSGTARALRESGIEVVAGDMRDGASLTSAARNRSHVYHLAARKSAHHASASQFNAVNVAGTLSLARASVAAGVERFVYTSTLGVHGFRLGGAIDESSAINPNTAYRTSKWQGEEVLRTVHRETELPVVIARLSSAVGPRARSWLPFVRGIQEQRIRLVGDGRNYIDLVSIDDIVDGIELCADTPHTGVPCYVLGAPSPMTFRAFADDIARAVGCAPAKNGPPAAPYRAVFALLDTFYRFTGVNFHAAHDREVLVTDKWSSSAKALREIGYAPSRSIEDATRDMVRAFIANGDVKARPI